MAGFFYEEIFMKKLIVFLISFFLSSSVFACGSTGTYAGGSAEHGDNIACDYQAVFTASDSPFGNYDVGVVYKTATGICGVITVLSNQAGPVPSIGAFNVGPHGWYPMCSGNITVRENWGGWGDVGTGAAIDYCAPVIRSQYPNKFFNFGPYKINGDTC